MTAFPRKDGPGPERPKAAAATPPPATPAAADGRLNRVVGWTSFVLGAGSGLAIGLWSFDGPLPAPPWIGEYGDLPRRLVRLGHIAFFGLGFLNLHLARELPDLALGAAGKRLASWLMNFGNILLPPALFAAALVAPAKYLLPIPALSVLAALALVAFGACRAPVAGAPARTIKEG
jgi:hypothetical protein